MKWRRVALLVVAFSLMGSSLLFAADSTTQKVRFLLNDREVEEGGYIVDGKTYVPVRSLEGLVEYNDTFKIVNYYKPNVHISLLVDEKVFGDIKKTGKLKFNVFCQIDDLRTSISEVQVTITSPDGNTTVIQTGDIKEQKDNFWFNTKDYTYDFKTSGKYTVGFHMKPSGSSEFQLVAQKKVNVLK